VSDPEGPHFHVGMATMAEYAKYSFNLQHNLARTIIQQRLSMALYDEHNITISHELEQLKRENALLHGGTLPHSDQDREFKVANRHLCEAVDGWNYTYQQLEAARELVDERTHMIIHLECANEQQNLELEERATVIASLEQQIQVLPLQAPPTPAGPDTVSDVDEE
jgi:hypothetical protein